MDLYLRRRPRLPGAEDREVRELSAFLNSLPIHTVRPDLETFRNSNGISLKLANFAALDPQYPGAGMRSHSRADAEVWDRYAAHPDELRHIVEAIRNAAAGSALPSVPEPEEDEIEAEEGRLLTRLHRFRERNPALVRRKKEAAYHARGALPCEVCGFDFARTYGDLGDGFIEAHHVLPLATLRGRNYQVDRLGPSLFQLPPDAPPSETLDSPKRPQVASDLTRVSLELSESVRSFGAGQALTDELVSHRPAPSIGGSVPTRRTGPK